MNTKRWRSKQGGISIAMLILTLGISSIIGSYAYVAMNNQRLTQHSIVYMEAKIIAENAVALGAELFFQKLKNEPTIGAGRLSNLLQKSSIQDYIKAVSISNQKQTRGYSIENVHFSNKKIGRTNLVTIVSMVKNGSQKVAFKTDYVVVERKFLDYAIFTDGIFELAPWPNMNVHGQVRSNDIIRLGGASGNNKLTFYDQLFTSSSINILKGWSSNLETASRNILVKDKNNNKKDFYSLYSNKFKALDSDHPNWETKSLKRWQGRVKANIPKLKVPFEADDNHVLIEPIDTTNDDELLKREKLAWKAKNNDYGLTIRVDKRGNIKYQEGNSTTWITVNPSEKVTKKIRKTMKKDKTNGLYNIPKKPNVWIGVDENFKDARYQQRNISLVTIYMDRLIQRFKDKKIIYIEVADKTGSTSSFTGDPSDSLPAVRLRNGNDLSAASAGLTIATHRMTYVEGNYNVVDKVPALVAADSIVALSNGWKDSKAGTNRPRGTEETFYQMALMIGGYKYKDNNASHPINGIQNLVSFLENWVDDDAVYNYLGSYVKMFSSKDTSASINGGVFRAPERNVQYDSDFINSPPPGMPTALTTPKCMIWTEITWDEALALINN